MVKFNVTSWLSIRLGAFVLASVLARIANKIPKSAIYEFRILKNNYLV